MFLNRIGVKTSFPKCLQVRHLRLSIAIKFKLRKSEQTDYKYSFRRKTNRVVLNLFPPQTRFIMPTTNADYFSSFELIIYPIISIFSFYANILG